MQRREKENLKVIKSFLFNVFSLFIYDSEGAFKYICSFNIHTVIYFKNDLRLAPEECNCVCIHLVYV